VKLQKFYRRIFSYGARKKLQVQEAEIFVEAVIPDMKGKSSIPLRSKNCALPSSRHITLNEDIRFFYETLTRLPHQHYTQFRAKNERSSPVIPGSIIHEITTLERRQFKTQYGELRCCEIVDKKETDM